MALFFEMLSLQGMLFLLILTGVLCNKLHIITEAGRKTLSDLLINVILPCSIVSSFLSGTQLPDGFARNCVLAVVLSAAIQMVAIFGSRLVFRRYRREERTVLSYGMICSNSGFVGLPMAQILFGDLGVIYTSVFQIPIRFTMWSSGLSLFTSVSRRDVLRKVLLHPCIVSIFLGLVLMFVPVPIPAFLRNTLSTTGGCTIPVSMLVIGSILADAPIRSLFSRDVLWYTCLRLVLFPALVYVLLLPLPLDPILKSLSLLMSGMPAGSTTSILADKYDCDALFASEITFASTLFSIVTVPLLSLLM